MLSRSGAVEREINMSLTLKSSPQSCQYRINLLSLHGEGLIVSLCIGLPETSSFWGGFTLIGEAVREDKDMYLKLVQNAKAKLNTFFHLMNIILILIPIF